MIVITRNGKTSVYTGWKAWAIMAVSLLVAWALIALFAALFFGIAISVGVLLLLAIPAFLIVGLMTALTRSAQ